MGEDQWFQPTIKNRLSRTILLTKFKIEYGKFYDINNRFEETTNAGGTKIEGESKFEWGHSGRQLSPTGTTGTFQVHLDDTDEAIVEIYWDCPWGSPTNTLHTNYVKPGYVVAFNRFRYESGPLGYGDIIIIEEH